MTDTTHDEPDNPLSELAKDPHFADVPMAPAHALATVALNMSLKYHDINTIQDGVMYQQYKMEGRNMQDLHLDVVFDTAKRMEAHIMNAPSRLAATIMLDVLDSVAETDEEKSGVEELRSQMDESFSDEDPWTIPTSDRRRARMTEHDLKCEAIFFDAVEDGLKPFEVRLNDRSYQTGDILVLNRYQDGGYIPARGNSYGVGKLRRRVTYILQGGQYGIEPRYCVLGLGAE